jgi:hypothetical protein
MWWKMHMPVQKISVSLIFYADKQKKEQMAFVLPQYWRASHAEDVAFLYLQGEIPRGVESLPLGCYTGKQEFSTFGFPVEDGRRGAGLVLGPLEMSGFARLQLRSEETTNGFSGAPIWDDELEAVIGMVVGIGKGRSIHWDKQELYIPVDRYGRFPYLAFATPTETLYDICDIIKPSDICPYRGLDAFTADNANIFFGRGKAIEMLERKFQRYPYFLAVFGPSGSGKSSLVQAGLIPRLHERLILNEDVGVITTRPSTDPFRQLAEKGLIVEPDKPNSLVTAISRWLGQNEKKHLVLVVDQFEELFVTCSKPLQKDFVIQLAGLRNADLLTTVIIVTRNDFYSQFVELELLEEWMQESGGPTNIPTKLKREDLIAIIQNPAERHKLHFHGDLVEHIIKDVMQESVLLSDEEEQVALSTVLPLLEFTLKELWEHRNNGMLTDKAYKDMHGVAGSLTRWADKVISGFEKKKLPLIRSIFLALIYLGDEKRGYPDSRKPTSRNSLMSLCQNESERNSIQSIITSLITARLLVADRQDNEETIEIIHDALLRHWERLKQWIADHRPFLAWHQSFEERVLEWERQKRPKYLLYRGAQLKEAQAWARRNRPSKQEAAFLHGSAIQRILMIVGRIGVVLLLVSLVVFVGYVFSQPSKTLVTTLQDSNEAGSLRYCIDNAPTGSTIRFASDLRGTIILTGALAISKHLTIVGPGANRLTISGGSKSAIIHVTNSAVLNISGLGFKNSQTDIFAFLFNEGNLTVTNSVVSNNKTTGAEDSFGGGIRNSGKGTLTVINSTISNNSASTTTGNGVLSVGGGIYNEGTLTVTHSTILNNSVDGGVGEGSGGGIYNYKTGTVIVTDSILSGNSTRGKQLSLGGDIANYGKLTVTASTFSNNSASSSGGTSFGGGILNSEFKGFSAIIRFCTIYGNTSSTGGGIWTDPSGNSQVTISSSIVAANRAHDGSDISGSLISDGYNLIENFAGAKGLNARTDRQGHLADLKIDPMLRSNGGPTQTLMLLQGSSAIDAVPLQLCSITVTDISGQPVPITTDQRGEPRPDGSENACDIGAYESSY